MSFKMVLLFFFFFLFGHFYLCDYVNKHLVKGTIIELLLSMFGTQQLTHHDVITHVAFIFISTRMQGFLGPIVRAEKQLFYA